MSFLHRLHYVVFFPSQKSNRFLYDISVYEFVNTSKQNERQTNYILKESSLHVDPPCHWCFNFLFTQQVIIAFVNFQFESLLFVKTSKHLI